MCTKYIHVDVNQHQVKTALEGSTCTLVQVSILYTIVFNVCCHLIDLHICITGMYRKKKEGV